MLCSSEEQSFLLFFKGTEKFVLLFFRGTNIFFCSSEDQKSLFCFSEEQKKVFCSSEEQKIFRGTKFCSTVLQRNKFFCSEEQNFLDRNFFVLQRHRKHFLFFRGGERDRNYRSSCRPSSPRNNRKKTFELANFIHLTEASILLLVYGRKCLKGGGTALSRPYTCPVEEECCRRYSLFIYVGTRR